MDVQPGRAPWHTIALPVAGLALSVALYGLAVWAPGSLFDASSSLSDMSGLSYVSSGAHAAGLAVAALIAGLVCVRLQGGAAGQGTPAASCDPRLARTIAWTAGATCALLACSLVLWIAAFASDVSGPNTLVYAAAGLCGVADAACFCWWLSCIGASCADARRRHVTLACAAALAAVLSTLAVLPSAWVRGVVVCMLLALIALVLASVKTTVPGAGAAGARIGTRGVAANSPDAALSQETSASRFSSSHAAWHALARANVRQLPVLVASAVVSVAAPFVNGVLMLDGLPMATRAIIAGAMGLVVGAVLAAAWLLPRRPLSVFTILLAFIVALFVAFILNWIAGLRLSPVVLALSSGGYLLILYVVMESALDAAARAGLPVVATYGLGACLVMAARIAADVASLHLLYAGVAADVKTIVTMFLMVYLLTCAGFALYHALSGMRARKGEAAEADVVPAGAVSAREAASLPAEHADWELLAQRCERVAASHGLSQREREVLSLMMKGRNVPAIAEELGISRNTAQTHVRHLYEALGVHSRQELVAFVEGGAAGDGDGDTVSIAR